MKKFILIFTSLLILSGCDIESPAESRFNRLASVDADTAAIEQCRLGVTYYKSVLMLSPAFNPDGTLRLCESKHVIPQRELQCIRGVIYYVGHKGQTAIALKPNGKLFLCDEIRPK